MTNMGLKQWILCVFVMTTISTAQSKLIDLSHDHNFETVMSPGNPKYMTKNIHDGDIKPGVYAKFNSYSLGEHGGTHLDAPAHFKRGGTTLEDIPLENTIADGVMINCFKESDKDHLYSLPLQKIKDWEEENGQIPQGAAVVVNFNWSHKFNNTKAYYNTDRVEDMSTYEFPSVSAEAIDFLADERNIKILAVDTPSPDIMSGNFPVHVKLLSNEKLIVENLRDPARLPARGFRLHATPVKFVKATGVQIRAFAILDEETENHGSRVSPVSVLGFLAMFIFSQLFN